MKPVNFLEANTIATKPEGWTDEQCGELPVLKGVEEETGFPFVISMWQPSDEDLRALQEGRGLILKLICPVQVPVSIYTLDENGNCNP